MITKNVIDADWIAKKQFWTIIPKEWIDWTNVDTIEYSMAYTVTYLQEWKSSLESIIADNNNTELQAQKIADSNTKLNDEIFKINEMLTCFN